MAHQENADALHRALLRFKVRDLEGYLALYDSSVIHHGFSSRIRPGIAGLRHHYTSLLAGFPDARIDIDDLIVDGDKVAHRFMFSGTHKAEFLGVPPSGKLVRAPGVHIHHFRNGHAVEVWQVFDNLSFLSDIGAVSRTRAKK